MNRLRWYLILAREFGGPLGMLAVYSIVERLRARQRFYTVRKVRGHSRPTR